MAEKNIVLFASGNGSNADVLMRYFKGHKSISVAALFCNNKNAGVIEKAESHQVPVVMITKEDIINPGNLIIKLSEYKTDLIILCGFLWLLPEKLVHAYNNRIINIHPALLPSYGGKGMYGMNVHKAVLNNKEMVSGITIHLVNEEYDKGEVLLQKQCAILSNDTAESLSSKIQKLEHTYLAPTIEKYLDHV